MELWEGVDPGGGLAGQPGMEEDPVDDWRGNDERGM